MRYVRAKVWVKRGRGSIDGTGMYARYVVRKGDGIIGDDATKE